MSCLAQWCAQCHLFTRGCFEHSCWVEAAVQLCAAAVVVSKQGSSRCCPRGMLQAAW